MINLLEETIEIIQENGKSIDDVLWVGTQDVRTTWENFADVADVEYDNGYGSQEVARDLLIVGRDWWLEREGYGGREWWSFKTYIKDPKKIIKLKAVTFRQAAILGFDVSLEWENLAAINGIKK